MRELGAVVAVAGLILHWFLRAQLLKSLERRHPATFFSVLGAPTPAQLADRGAIWSTSRRNLKRRYLKFVWTFEFLGLRDAWISALGLGVVMSGVVIAAGLIAVAMGGK
jgi:hypothetical protein